MTTEWSELSQQHHYTEAPNKLQSKYTTRLWATRRHITKQRLNHYYTTLQSNEGKQTEKPDEYKDYGQQKQTNRDNSARPRRQREFDNEEKTNNRTDTQNHGATWSRRVLDQMNNHTLQRTWKTRQLHARSIITDNQYNASTTEKNSEWPNRKTSLRRLARRHDTATTRIKPNQTGDSRLQDETRQQIGQNYHRNTT